MTRLLEKTPGAEPNRRQLLGRAAAFASGLTASAAGLQHPAAAQAGSKPPAPIKDWLRRATDPPFRIPLDYVGLHSNHGLGAPLEPPAYAYDAIRSHDTDDGAEFPATQWARIEVKPGVYDWRGVDAWIAAHPGRTRIWVLFGCPAFYQKYPGEPWRYPYLPGGGSPPREPEVAAAFIRALLARHPGQIHFVEIWNEPNFGPGRGGLEGRWLPSAGRLPGFFTGTAGDLAALARAVRGALSGGVKLMAGAWESQSEGRTPANSLIRFSLAPDGAGGRGRDHVDALSVHAYTYNNDANAMIRELRAYRQRFADAGYPANMPVYVTECGAEAPGAWSAGQPPLTAKLSMIKRWLMIPAALGYSGLYLYKHSVMRTLGDPQGQPALGEAITAMRNSLRGRIVSEAALLTDERIWISFSDGTFVSA